MISVISAFGVEHEVAKAAPTAGWAGSTGKRGLQRGIQHRWEQKLTRDAEQARDADKKLKAVPKKL